MATDVKVAAYEGGRLRLLASGDSGREVVLGLPLNRLLVRMVRVPAEADPVEVATPILKSASPFPDDELTVSCETVCEDEGGRVVIAAALPESAADDIGEALDAAKFSVVRIDVLVLGLLRGAWNALGESSERRLIVVRSAECLSLVVLDGDRPSAIRAITDATDLKRETMLSLLEAEDFGGARKLEEVVWIEGEETAGRGEEGGESDGSAPVAQDPLADLAFFAPVRRITVGADAALVGVAERSAAGDAINALPESWAEVLEETRFKAKLVRFLAVACGFWAVVMGVLFGVPVAYGFMTDHQKGLSRQHARQYAAVKEMKSKVDLIHKYSDHARGALEIMKALSDRLPEGITLSNWSYKRDEGVRVSGDAATPEDVYEFKDRMDALSFGEDGESERIFGVVELSGPNASKGGFRFDLDCRYQGEDDGEN